MAKRKGPGAYKPRRNYQHLAIIRAGEIYEPMGKPKRGKYRPTMFGRYAIEFYFKPRKRA